MSQTSWWSSRKWWQYQILKKDPVLSRVTPETRIMTEKTLWRMLNQYGSVVVKPVGGSLGRGVVHIEKTRTGTFRVHHLNKVRFFPSKASTFKYLATITQGQRQLVQQRIFLCTINGAPFDLRVMVQRMDKKPWQVTGKLVKVAGPGYFVTNVMRSHGRILPYQSKLVRSAIGKNANFRNVTKEIDATAQRAADLLSRHRTRMRTVGLDLGIDRQGKPWIIEVNFMPMTWMFRNLPEKNTYRRIQRFQRGTAVN